MATWTAPIDTETDPDAPLLSSLGKRWDNNCIAIAEGASGAPIVEGAWHPYDAVFVGDGNDGLIYDHGVDGAVGSVVTPDFEDGYEYRVVGVDLSLSGGLSFPVDIDLDLYKSVDAAYQSAASKSINTSSAIFSLDVVIVTPMISSQEHFTSGQGWPDGSVVDSTVQEILRARLNPQGKSFDAGKIYMLRRRIYFDV